MQHKVEIELAACYFACNTKEAVTFVKSSIKICLYYLRAYTETGNFSSTSHSAIYSTADPYPADQSELAVT